MRALNKTDYRIINTAKQLFITYGVERTEMKDIAGKLNIARSTLYRHFPNKESIIFVLAIQSLEKINSSIKLDNENFADGFEEFSARMHALTDALLLNKDDVRFLRDFDYLFTDEYPKADYAVQFEEYLSARNGIIELEKSFRRGILDGSIYPFKDPSLVALTFLNSCIALAQRILPRIEHYKKEQGYAEEYLKQHIELLLSSIHADRT